MTKIQLELTELFDDPTYYRWHTNLYYEFVSKPTLSDGRIMWFNAWYSFVANSIGGKLVEISYKTVEEGAEAITSVKIEIDEGEFTMFLLSI